MNERGAIFLSVSFVLAEGINVWACWNNPPFSGSLGDIPTETLKKGEKSAALFTLGYGLFATVATKNLLPLFIALGFNALMYWIYESQHSQEKENYGKHYF